MVDDYMEQATHKASSSNYQNAHKKPYEDIFPSIPSPRQAKPSHRECDLCNHGHALVGENGHRNHIESDSDASDVEFVNKPTPPKEKGVPVLRSVRPAFSEALD